MSEAVIRPMQPEERRVVKRLARRAFGIPQGLAVKPTDNTLVYELAGQIVGVVILDSFGYKRKKLGGVVKWLFTDPAARGRGAAAALVERSVARLKELGCHELFTTVEGFNTASSNRFADLGFVPVSAMQQLRRYGLSIIKIGVNTFHTIDLGHFLWVRPASEPSSTPADQAVVSGGGAPAWWANVCVMAALVALQRLRIGAAGRLHPHLIWQIPAAVALVFGVRTMAMKLAGRALGIKLRYRIWETGLTLSALVTVLFGGVLPSPGSCYPRTVRWSYQTELRRLGIVAFSGALGILALGWLLFASEAAGFPGIPASVSVVLTYAAFVVEPLLVFEVLLPFFPFASYNGRRVWDYRPVLWAFLAAGVVGLFWISIFGA